MGSRLRFLHCMVTELWGHGQKAAAGDGEPGASRGARREEKPPPRGGAVKRSGMEVAKEAGWPSRKAAIDCHAPVPETDTGGWGEDPKAGGRSTAKELGKMAP